MKEDDQNKVRSGYVSIIGRPNVGKSTLMNTILGEKITIVTPKPQTTRNRIIGVKNIEDAQIVFIDTPGVHNPKHRLGETMVKTTMDTLQGVDIIIYVVEPKAVDKIDSMILNTFKNAKSTVFLAINKIDTLKKSELLPIMDYYENTYSFEEIIPISALKGDGIDLLIETLCPYLPFGPRYYPDDLITDQFERFMVAEIIREKIMSMTEHEVPHAVAVHVDEWEERHDGLIMIKVQIYVERESQKAIIIGKKGLMLKSIGTAARRDIENILHTKIFLQMWVKVKKHWRNNPQLLKELGYR